MTEFKQIIVVEGRDDTKRLRLALGDVDTIETGGSAINAATLEKIALAQQVRGVIVMTDPDFQGQRIRNIIRQHVPDAQHAFLPRKAAVPERSGGSLGVEHADAIALRKALASVATPDTLAPTLITQADLMTAGFIGVRRPSTGGNGSVIFSALATRTGSSCSVACKNFASARRISPLH